MIGKVSRVMACCPLADFFAIAVSQRVGIGVALSCPQTSSKHGPPELTAVQDTRPKPRFPLDFEPFSTLLKGAGYASGE